MNNEINSNGFRSEKFKTDHAGKLHVLFAGAEETFGVNSTLDDTWSSMTLRKLEKHSDVSGYFNIGKPGLNFIDICNNVKSYINDFSPNVIFIIFPGFRNCLLNDASINNFINEVSQLEDFCNSKNIKIYWSSIPNNLNLEDENIILLVKEYIYKNKNKLLGFVDIAFFADGKVHIENLLKDHPHFTIENSAGSFGTVYHAYWSNRFDTRYVADLEKN